MLLISLLSACSDGLVPSVTIQNQNNSPVSRGSAPDDDGDGWDSTMDCDDTDEDINPGEDEDPTDSVDNDCDEMVDCDDNDADLTDSCYDADQDGWCDDTDGNGEIDIVFLCDVENDENAAIIAEQTGGDEALVENYIEVEYEGDPVSGYTLPDPDCNDEDPASYPDASEVCDGADNDCDGTVDDGVSTPTTYYADADQDGWGDANSLLTQCEIPTGYVTDNTDCNDQNSGVNPGAIEVCDSADTDEDCDTNVDDADGSVDVTTMTSWYLDGDSDTFGSAFVVSSCEAPSTTVVANNTDCNDEDATSFPGGTEVCDGADNDCDGFTDPNTSTNASTWYNDSDADGWGDVNTSQVSCSAPTGYVADSTDCDDTTGSINPGSIEVCDSANTDEDCDGSVDDVDLSVDPSTMSIWYQDADTDSFGNALNGASACDAPTGYVADSTDCDDANSASWPGAPEACDSSDNDCDGTADEGVEATFYADSDQDSYGDASITDEACEAPTGYVSDSTDFNDQDATVYPGAPELCDDQDNGCDGGTVDLNAVNQTTWWRDSDGDDYGDPNELSYESCDAPNGYVVSDGDCDDDNADINPLVIEVFNEVDDNCNNLVDENTSCEAVLEIYNDSAAVSIQALVVSDDGDLEGEWYPNSVQGVSTTAVSLGGNDWGYESVMDLCITGSGYVIVRAEFEDGTSLCESGSATGLIYGTMDDVDLSVSAYDNGDGTCDSMLSR